MIPRLIESVMKRDMPNYSIFCVFGPRYVGKTTLVKSLDPNFAYVSCRELQPRQEAQKNSAAFVQRLLSNRAGIIIDDCEYAPELMKFLGTYNVPEGKKIIITSSLISIDGVPVKDMIARHAKMYTLWPLSIAERETANILPTTLDEAIVRGSFPLSQKETDFAAWHTQYVRIYCEQDVRVAKSLHNETIFYRFLELCANSIGKPVNYSSLRRACDITIHTAKAWIELLEQTQFIFLQPNHETTYGKRIIKSPKLYFIEPALACAILNIKTAQDLHSHQARQSLVESLIISDLYKQAFAEGRQSNCSFWIDKAGHEIACLLTKAEQTVPLQITDKTEYDTKKMKEIYYWYKLSKSATKNGIMVYDGQNQTVKDAQLVNWRSSKNLNQ